ncbi:hypothetical protein CLAIMM_02289 [Cladophialophora immunda]|nr:hypothetical protein CLAIMM_02289 [Cladophialophora immunda]
MLNLLLLAAMTATLLALPATGNFVLPVDNLEAIKLPFYYYDIHSQKMRFGLPFPNNPWGANGTEILQLDLKLGNCPRCFDVAWVGTTPVPYPKHFYHPYTLDSSGAMHVAGISIGDFPRGTTADDETGDLPFAITSVDHQPLDKPLAFSVTWNFQKPKQRLGRLVYQPEPQVIEFAEFDNVLDYLPPPPLEPNRTCPPLREMKLLEYEEKTQKAVFTLICEDCFRSAFNAPDSLIFSVQPQPQPKVGAFSFLLNNVSETIKVQGSNHRAYAPDALGVVHTLDLSLSYERFVVAEDYSELGSINGADLFILDFWILAIDGKRPSSERVTFQAKWDLLGQIDRRIPRWESLQLKVETTAIRFPFPKNRKGLGAPPGRAASRVSLMSPPQTTTQGSTSLPFSALLILVGFVAGLAIPRRPGRRR